MDGRQYEIEWRGSPNFWKGRRGRRPIAIVNHITAGLMPGCPSWMLNPASGASAHYLVARDGRSIQLVKDEDTAWANGVVNRPDWSLYDGSNPNPNLYTLSIEREGLAGDGLTEEQYQATLWLHRQLVDRWGIPVDRDHIIGHYRIDSVNRPNCPGQGFPWDRLFRDLERGDQTMPESWKLNIVKEAKEEGIITSDHDPDGSASVWFVLAVAINVLKVVRKMLGVASGNGR